MGLRILHISTRLILGGSQENTVLSCEGQSRLGHEVHLAYGPIYGPEGSLLERVNAFACTAPDGTERRITTHEVPDLVREVSPLRDARCLGQLKALIRRVRPDVIHTHSSKAGILGRVAGWAVWRAGDVRAAAGVGGGAGGSTGPARPMVMHTIHGPPFMPVEGGLGKRLKVRLNNLVYTVAEKHAAARCHVIVSVADAMTQQFLARGIGRPELYMTVRSGMDLGPYDRPAADQERGAMRAALGLRPEHFVAGTVARLAEHKGHADVLAAMERLRAPGAGVGPGMNLEQLVLLWVGDGWLRQELTARAGAAGFNVISLDKPGPAAEAWRGAVAGRPSVVLTGLVPPQRVPGLVRAMDVLVHPSYREGLPRTVPQALLCGVCPIATDVDGTREVCVDGVTGKLVRLGDIDALAGAVRWAWEHPAERAALAEAGRQMVRQRWSTEAMVAGLEEAMGVGLGRSGG